MERQELGKGEGTRIEEPFRIRCFAIALLDLGHRESHDLVLAVGKPLLARHPCSVIPDRSKHEVWAARDYLGQSSMGHAKKMRDRHDPAAIIAVRIVEDLKLPGGPTSEVAPTEPALVFQGNGNRIGEPLPGTHEAARQCPVSSAISGAFMQEHRQATVWHHGEQGDIHGHVGCREGAYRLSRHGPQATAASLADKP